MCFCVYLFVLFVCVCELFLCLLVCLLACLCSWIVLGACVTMELPSDDDEGVQLYPPRDEGPQLYTAATPRALFISPPQQLPDDDEGLGEDDWSLVLRANERIDQSCLGGCSMVSVVQFLCIILPGHAFHFSFVCSVHFLWYLLFPVL